jgi:DNA-binding response OmpR family regulator
MNGRVLVVEDDELIAFGVVEGLKAAHYEVLHAGSGEEALEHVETWAPDILTLDVNLPGIDGLTVLKRLRSSHPELPVILVTARSSEIDRVLGFELGADDFVPKPFSVRELTARVRLRIRTHVRTIPEGSPETFRFGPNQVDLRRRVLNHAGIEHRLTTYEAGVLGYLIEHRGQEVTREDLLREVWGYSPNVATRTVDNQILKLRKKVEVSAADPLHILTVHGTGYRFEP